MCRWYCTSEGPSTDLTCLHCHVHYCAACLHGEAGKMESLVKCARCGRKPRVLDSNHRGDWRADALSQPQAIHTLALETPTSPGGRRAKPTHGNIFDRLTDSSLYTGSHKHRFDADGHGRGLDGRDSTPKGVGRVPQSHVVTAGGTIADLSSILRNDRAPSNTYSSPRSASRSPTNANNSGAYSPGGGIGSPNRNGGGSGGGGGGNIFDRLTDASLYTGAHKHRFDSGGRGRGMSGRDAASGIQYHGAAVSDLSQITRPNLR